MEAVVNLEATEMVKVEVQPLLVEEIGVVGEVIEVEVEEEEVVLKMIVGVQVQVVPLGVVVAQ